MKNFIISSLGPIAIALAIIPFSANAEAVKCVVVYNKTGCHDYYVAETNMGYVIIEWYGGTDPSEGDVLVGDLESYGFKDVYDLTKESSTRVYIDDYGLGKNSLQEKFFEKRCRK